MPATVGNDLQIYWSNVCTLKKMEKEKLSGWASQWKDQRGLDVKVDFFGLGEEAHINEEIASELQKGDLGADVIVSTDIHVFNDTGLLLGQTEQFQSLREHLPLRKELAQAGITHPSGCFCPCGVALLVMVYNNKLVKESEKPKSWGATLEPEWQGKILFGGTKLPAGQGFLRGIWYLYGDEGLERCIRNYKIATSPATVLHAVSNGEFPAGVVSLAFTGRKGLENVTEIWPEEGAIAIASYVAIRHSAPEMAVSFVKETIFSEETQQFYSQNALIVPVVPGVPPPDIVLENDFKIVHPEWSWVQRTDMAELNEVAKRLSSL